MELSIEGNQFSGMRLYLKSFNLIPQTVSHLIFCFQIETEIRFQVHCESTLTEPYVAHVISEVVASGARPALFVGNSMVLRDLDMYAKGSITSTSDSIYTANYLQQGFHGIPVAGNRGASGIDGLLSTAIGFSIGSEKRVPYFLSLVIGFYFASNNIFLNKIIEEL